MFRESRLAFSLALSLTSAPFANAQAPANGVYIVGALHRLHEVEPAFDYATLKALIEAARPDILVLEVRPDELADLKDTQGRPEYPAVIWPILKAGGVAAVAMEPGGDLFTSMVGRGKAAFDAFGARDAEGRDQLEQISAGVRTALLAHWQTLADTQDSVTDGVVKAEALALFHLVGPDMQALQTDWDNHMIAVAREAISQNAGKRVLILCSYKNRATLEAGLKAATAGRLVAPADWPGAAAP